MRLKHLFFLLLLPLMLFLTGCGGDLSVETKINPDESGTRILKIKVANDQFKDVKGGEAALAETLAKNAPADFKLNRNAEANGVSYTLTMDFKSINELREKSQRLTGGNVPISFDKKGSPFAVTYSYNDPVRVEDYFSWAINAVKKDGLVAPNNYGNMINSQNATVSLPTSGKEEWQRSSGNWVTSRYTHPIDSVTVETDIRDNSRTLKIAVPADTDKKMRGEKGDPVGDYYKTLVKDAETASNTSNDMVEYQVKVKASKYEELISKSAPLFKDERSTIETVKDSIFHPVIRFTDNINIGYSLGDNANVKNGYSYRLLFDGKVINPDGTDVLVDGKPLKGEALVKQGSRVSVNYTIERTGVMFYGAIVLGLLAIVGFGFFGYRMYRTNPEKFNFNRPAAPPQPATWAANDGFGGQGAGAAPASAQGSFGQIAGDLMNVAERGLAGVTQAGNGPVDANKVVLARKVSPALFGLILICFLLPFVTVSCQGHEVVTLTEMQFATGSTIESPDLMTGKNQSEKIDANPFATGALVVTVAGLAVCFVRLRSKHMLTAGLAVVGLALNLFLKNSIDNEILKKGSGMLQLSYGFGFYGSLLLYLAAIGAGVFLLRSDRPGPYPPMPGNFPSGGSNGPWNSPEGGGDHLPNRPPDTLADGGNTKM
ncbi:hypothetical protein GTO89_06155 [Heliobacterium gestii]|uniref:Uncharacterized protein n=1 Tax=Heliomicrobium gestii TaxID=2699 RepID=A0A845LCH3_HELGE|nr:hypothetical protein [Heliomicrobium gestii]MBM7866050.1 hypothetical protein [Heliomicrobium gestii]MZP42620.1 hypothetical protein [Heliomicrobium gestii]